MNLHEEVSRIKSMMGVLTEDEVTFPIIKSGSYTAPLGNCDKLHAFNDTKSGPVGKMNDIVNPILLDVYKKGFNPDITDIEVEITRGSEYKVNWSVTINESTDGNAWVGLYSRGHGGGADWVFDDVSATEGHASIEACKTSNYIKKRGIVDEMVLVKDYEFTYKIQKTQIKASGGINGLHDFINEINTQDSPFNPSLTNLFINL
jgi:hypothetical protein